jgi:shikimate dehydrogenase
MQLQDRRYFGLLGEVVDGNPTEEMMQAAFEAAGLPWKYISIPVPAESFPAAFAAARALGFAGLHITKPFKIAAASLVDRLTPAAALIGAVNCIYAADGMLVGDNTDGRGLVRAVAPIVQVDGARVVVLGAGGAARAVAVELAMAGAIDVTIVNRSRDAAQSLVAALGGLSSVAARFLPWTTAITLQPETDLVVNATSIGMLDAQERPDVDLSALRESAVVADVVIAPSPTRFLLEADARGLRFVEGNEMLVKQAAISYEVWTSGLADESVLRTALAWALLNPTPRQRLRSTPRSTGRS